MLIPVRPNKSNFNFKGFTLKELIGAGSSRSVYSTNEDDSMCVKIMYVAN